MDYGVSEREPPPRPRDGLWASNRPRSSYAGFRRHARTMKRFWCPYLRGGVELPLPRERHILEEHPELVPRHHELIATTLADPDLVRRSTRSKRARLFSRWHPEVLGGKHVVVVVVTDPGILERHWVVTAYVTRRPAGGRIEWERS